MAAEDRFVHHPLFRLGWVALIKNRHTSPGWTHRGSTKITTAAIPRIASLPKPHFAKGM